MQQKIGETVTDGVMVTILGGAVVELIPIWATATTAVWFTIKVWESDTVKGWTGRKKKDEEKDG